MRLNKYKNNYKTGFTLVEMLLYLAVSGVVLGAVASSVFFIWQVKVKTKAIYEVEQQGVFLMNYFAKAVENSDDVISPLQGQVENSLNLDSSTNGPGSIVLFEEEGKLVANEGSQTFYLTSPAVLFSNLTFTNVSKSEKVKMVKISFTLSFKSNTSASEYYYQSNFYGSAIIQK